MDHNLHLGCRWSWRFLRDQETGADTLRRPGATDACFTLSAGRRARRRPPSSGNATRPTGIENDVERARKEGRRGRGACMGGVGERRRSRNNFKRRQATSLALRDVAYPWEVRLFASFAVQDKNFIHLMVHNILTGTYLDMIFLS